MSGMTRSCRITVGLISLATRSPGGIGAVVEGDVGLAEQRAAHGLADHRLIVDQQHHDGESSEAGAGVIGL